MTYPNIPHQPTNLTDATPQGPDTHVDLHVATSNFINNAQDRISWSFATVAERDTQWPNPPDGAFCYVTAIDQHFSSVGGDWGVWPPQIKTVIGSALFGTPGTEITATAPETPVPGSPTIDVRNDTAQSRVVRVEASGWVHIYSPLDGGALGSGGNRNRIVYLEPAIVAGTASSGVNRVGGTTSRIARMEANIYGDITARYDYLFPPGGSAQFGMNAWIFGRNTNIHAYLRFRWEIAAHDHGQYDATGSNPGVQGPVTDTEY